MKTVKFLCWYPTRGLYSYSPRHVIEPYDEKKHADIDFTEDAGCILSDSDWRHVSVPKYAVEEREIPEWIEPSEWNDQIAIAWKYYKKIGGTEEMGRKVFEKVINVKDPYTRYAVVKLLKTKNFRSEFRKSLRKQVDEWVEGKSKYDTPLSSKQVHYVLSSHDKIAVKNLLY